MSYTVRILHDGPRYETIKQGLPRARAGFAYVVDWCAARDMVIVHHEPDVEHDAWDIMAARGGELVQFTVDCECGL